MFGSIGEVSSLGTAWSKLGESYLSAMKDHYQTVRPLSFRFRSLTLCRAVERMNGGLVRVR